MARLQPFAEVVGAEQLAPTFEADDLARLPAVHADGSPLRHGAGVPVGQILDAAADGSYPVPLSPRDLDLLSRLDELDHDLQETVRTGVVIVPVKHLQDVATGERIRIGYELTFDDHEITLLGI